MPATNPTPAARLADALEEKAETSNPVEKSDIKSILIHEGMMTND